MYIHKINIPGQNDWTIFIFCSNLIMKVFVSCVQLFVTPWTVAHQGPLFMGFSRQEYRSGLPCLPPGDLLIQGSNPHLLCLLHYRWILYHLATEESPKGCIVKLKVAQSCPAFCDPKEVVTPIQSIEFSSLEH